MPPHAAAPHDPLSPTRAAGPDTASRRERWQHGVLRGVAALLVAVIFLVDTLTTLEGAVAVLYVVAVMLVARTARRGDIVAVAVAGIVLTVYAYLDTHGLRHVGAQTFRAAVSLAAIAISAVLALENQHAVQSLKSQAMLLDLSHDMIFTRGRDGRIAFWNRGAAEVYGFSAQEAVGRIADELLRTRYAQPRALAEAALEAEGRWEGTLVQTTRDGRELHVESRWALQRDASGRTRQVLETHTDVTARQAAHAALVHSEQRYRRMFDATRIGVVQQDWRAVHDALAERGIGTPAGLAAHLARHPGFAAQARDLVRIERANPAFAAIAGRTQDAMPTSLSGLLDAAEETFVPSLLAYAGGESFFEGETELLRADGQRVPVLFTITFPTADDGEGSVLVFVVDITERRQAQDAMLAAQAELAHAMRVATLGELTASIAHEVNQPLMAVVTNGEAGMRWLRRDTPDLHEVETAIARIIAEGRRAGEIVRRVRDFLSKAPAPQQTLSPGALLADAVELVRHEFTREGVEVRVQAEDELPWLRGDRVQLEQVLVNLMVNACQALAGWTGTRQVLLHAGRGDGGTLAIRVADTGPGIAAADLPRLFDPFYTTKPNGMGMGLAICRTTAEAHGGHLTVESTPGQGTVFLLTLAPCDAETHAE
ncbi:PAS domain-containing sensor histidine kinase [Stenotrophomonas panacihumi]|uniref:PAS domain-containing sensor histidine kinase n=2 Tax=Stenotrophomonas panacihumi TaxID=676599 RepID=UPI000D38DC3E|nr:ATP-binding protein [Stenotrophomonas panacihumi]PTN55925.1 PAS domain-containing sensor histidine kinase [Stenotrophomonas panacihumi]